MEEVMLNQNDEIWMDVFVPTKSSIYDYEKVEKISVEIFTLDESERYDDGVENAEIVVINSN
jgi:hypothetical protein